MATGTRGILCDSGNSVLTVIDIQTRLTAAMPAKVLARLQRSSSLLLRAAAALDIPVYATQQYPRGLGSIEPEILKLFPDSAEMYEKTCFSCAGADGFMGDLKQSGRRQVVLTGMETHVCVLQSAIDLLNLDYEVIIASDAVCSRQRESYETSLQRMRQAGAIITTSESLVFEWLRDSKHPHFKALQPFLK